MCTDIDNDHAARKLDPAKLENVREWPGLDLLIGECPRCNSTLAVTGPMPRPVPLECHSESLAVPVADR